MPGLSTDIMNVSQPGNMDFESGQAHWFPSGAYVQYYQAGIDSRLSVRRQGQRLHRLVGPPRAISNADLSRLYTRRNTQASGFASRPI